MPRTPIENFSYDAPDDLPGLSTALSSSSDPQDLLAFQVEAAIQEVKAQLTAGFRFFQTLYITSSTTFVPTDFPLMRAVQVTCQGAGGGGGGATTTTATQWSGGGGGGGGSCAKAWVPRADMGTSISIQVGSGGDGGTAAAGSGGGGSTFGAHCRGNGGLGGAFRAASSVQGAAAGGGGSFTGVGDVIFSGSDGVHCGTSDPSMILSFPYGGGAPLGGVQNSSSSVGGNSGFVGHPYGGGGSGGFNDTAETEVKTGGSGAQGIVIVEIYI